MLGIRSTLRNPPLEELDVARAECATGSGRRHTACRIASGYPLKGSALSRMAGIDGPVAAPVLHRFFASVEAEPGHPRAGVLPMARKALGGQHRPDVAIKVDLVGNRR
jgi:hypothetical protein